MHDYGRGARDHAGEGEKGAVAQLTQAEGEYMRAAAAFGTPSIPRFSHLPAPVSVEQNPNVAFDFDHWEEHEEESRFPKGKTGCTPSWGGAGAECHGAHPVTPPAWGLRPLWTSVIDGKPLGIRFLLWSILMLNVLVRGGTVRPLIASRRSYNACTALPQRVISL